MAVQVSFHDDVKAVLDDPSSVKGCVLDGMATRTGRRPLNCARKPVGTSGGGYFWDIILFIKANGSSALRNKYKNQIISSSRNSGKIYELTHHKTVKIANKTVQIESKIYFSDGEINPLAGPSALGQGNYQWECRIVGISCSGEEEEEVPKRRKRYCIDAGVGS